MALTFAVQRAVEIAVHGVGLVIVPPRDATTNLPWAGAMEIERAPDSSGSPGTPESIAILEYVAPNGTWFFDPRPLTTAVWWYRYRGISDAGAVTSAWSGWRSATAALLTEGTKRDPGGRGFYAGLRAEQLSDGKRALKASDTVGKETDDDLFIVNTKTVKVGTVASPGSLTKTIRIPASETVPSSNNDTWVYQTGHVQGNTNNVLASFVGSMVLPKGVTITAFRTRLYRGTTSDTATATLRRLASDAQSDLAANTHNATGWLTQSTSLSQLVGDESYFVFITLQGVATDGDARFQFAELDYTMPSYDRGY
jgi:hypothetical protein